MQKEGMKNAIAVFENSQSDSSYYEVIDSNDNFKIKASTTEVWSMLTHFNVVETDSEYAMLY